MSRARGGGRRRTAVDRRDENGRTPLHIAILNYNFSRVLQRLEGANVNAQDNDGQTPLHYAVKFSQKEASAALIAVGADLYIKDKHDRIPREYALNNEIERLLLYPEEAIEAALRWPEVTEIRERQLLQEAAQRRTRARATGREQKRLRPKCLP